ncbi:MAG: sensor histidine kinase [Acidimicrobiia bacterium]
MADRHYSAVSQMRIRWRLTWFGIGFTALVLVGFILILSLLIAGTASSEQDALLVGIAVETAAELDVASAGVIDVPVPPVLPDASTSDQPFLTVYDEAGQVLYATGLVGGAPLDLPASVHVEALEKGSSSVNVDGVRVQVSRWDNPTYGVGVVAASQSERVADSQLRGAQGFLVVFGIIALTAAAIGAWFMAGRALRPIKTLADTTERIGTTGDLSQRLPGVKQDDEVGALTDSFNAMLEGLQIARRDRDLTIDTQKRFVADASHELRSPLTSIRANAGFLVERPDASDADRRDASRDVAHEADRMSHLIDDLLTLARSDIRIDDTQDFAPVDLSTVARSVQRRARNLELSVDVQTPETAVVLGHDGELSELIWILVDNADRHGGSSAVITIDQDAERTTIEVTDDGEGIPHEDLERVFDRFHRADPARSGPGFGLGLAIARAITERHGGSIEAGNQPDGGARFLVKLPSAR